MAKMSIVFDGFKDLAYQIDKAGGDVEKAVDEALSDTFDVVQSNLEKASAVYSSKGGGRKGYATSDMYHAIKKDRKIYWKGTVAEVGVGFNLDKSFKGGYHSIFIMYGTPKIAKDSKVYNAIKGTKTKKDIAEAQKKAMIKYLKI